MRDKPSILIVILRKIVLSVILVMLAAPSCINRNDKTKHEDLIPEKKFVSILTDIYIANGLLTIPEIRKVFSERDSVLNYIDIIESYGYSYEKMNNTVNYYFVSKPKKLIRIYDQILGKLSEMESVIDNEIFVQSQKESKKEANYNIYYFPDIQRKENPGLSIVINPPGTYNITLSVTVYPDDLAYNPHLSAWIVDADSVNTGRKIWLPIAGYVKDGQPHQIIYTGRVEQKRPMIIKTILYDYDNNIREWDRHAKIEILFSNFIAKPK